MAINEIPHYIELDFNNNRFNSNNIDNKQQQKILSDKDSRMIRYQQQKQQIDKYFQQNNNNTIENHHYLKTNFFKNRLKNNNEKPKQYEDSKDFATFLCIFASVMTIVLILMFYMVGETVFRLILLVISFVAILTLCLACFLRRPTLIILGQTNISNNNNNNDNNSIKLETQNNNAINTSPQPYLMIFPTLFDKNIHTDTEQQ